MVSLLILAVILVIIGLLFRIASAFGSEKDRQNRIFEEALYQKQFSLDNQAQDKKQEAVLKKDNIRPLPKIKSPGYFPFLARSQS